MPVRIREDVDGHAGFRQNSGCCRSQESIREAVTVFLEPFSLTIPNAVHSGEEERFVEIGFSAAERAAYEEKGF